MTGPDKIKISFSVSLCVYGKDHPLHFKAAVDSILGQSIQPDQIVLVVDGPVPDELDDIIKQFDALDFFKVIRLPQNVGHGNARRIGFENCTHELIALMDADDISVPNRFEIQMACFKADPALSAAGGAIKEFIDDTSKIVGVRSVPLEDAAIKKYIKKRCPFNQMTVMFRASDVKKAGGYLDWYCDEDYYLWLRMTLAGCRFYNLADTLVNVRVGTDMYNRRGGWRYFKSEAKLQGYMLKNHMISLPRCVFNTAIRFFVQVLLPSNFRGLFYRLIARNKVSSKQQETSL